MALYNFGVALEARRWHIADYEAVLPGIRAEHVQASCCCCIITVWLALGAVQVCAAVQLAIAGMLRHCCTWHDMA